MSLLGSFLGNAAGAGAQIIGDRMKADDLLKNQTEYAKMQNELQLERDKTIEAIRESSRIAAENRANERTDKPLKDFGGLVNKYAGEDIAQEAAPVKNLTGAGNAFDGKPLTETTGLTGDAKKWRAQVEAMPDSEDKQNILKQLDSQMEADTAKNQDAVTGKTRKRTTAEATAMAREEAMRTDPNMVAAYEKNIGRSERDERRLDIQDTKNDNIQEFNMRRLERQDKLSEIREAEARVKAAAAEGRALTKEEKDDRNQNRQVLTSLMTSTERELERTMALAKDAAMVDPTQAKMYQTRADRLTRDLASYRAGLEGLVDGGVTAGKAQPSTPPPDGTRGTFNGVTGVVRNGQFVPDSQAPKKQEQSSAPAPAPAASSPARPFVEDAALSAKADQEAFEMGSGSRMKYSPDVKAYVDAKIEAERTAKAVKRKQQSDQEFQREQQRRKAMGY